MTPERLLALIEPLVDQLAERVAEKIAARLSAEPKYMTLAGAAKRTGLSEKTIERAVSSGKVRRNKQPGRLLVVTTSLDAWIEGDPEI